MNINCTDLDISSTIFINLKVFKSSSGASTSSSRQNGAGFNSNIANTKAKAVRAFSPPESCEIDEFFLPGGLAINTTPAFRASSSVNVNSAIPPPNNLGNISLSLEFTASKLSLNIVLVSLSIFFIASVSLSSASTRSSYCSSSSSFLFDSSEISSGAARFMAPSLIILASVSISLSSISSNVVFS